MPEEMDEQVDEEVEMEPPRNFVTIALAVEGSLIVAALAIGRIVGHGPLSGLDFSLDALPDHAMAAWWGITATVPMLVGLVLLDRYPVGPLRGLREVVDRLLVPLFSDVSILQMALISLVAGVGEEMLFRGLLQGGLSEAIGPPWGVLPAVVVASAVFGLAHFITPTYAVLAGLIGVYLGWLFFVTGSLVAPMVTHAVYDFAALVYLTTRPHRGTRGLEGGEDSDGPPGGKIG